MKILILVVTILFALSSCNNPSNKEVTYVMEIETAPVSNVVENILNSDEKINLNGIDYYLAWTSHPMSNFYKHEYVPKGQVVEKFNDMILFDLIIGDMDAKNTIAEKIEQLEIRKQTDVVAGYNVSVNKKKNEFLLDFMLSDGNGDENTIVEWNVYRYYDYTDSKGNKGVIIFGLSRRGYGKNVIEFAENIKANRLTYLSEFINLKIPEIKLE